MTAVHFVAMIVMSVGFVVATIVIGKKSSAGQASIQQFQASLVKHLPPDVQADMKPRQLGPVIFVAILVVVATIVWPASSRPGIHVVRYSWGTGSWRSRVRRGLPRSRGPG